MATATASPTTPGSDCQVPKPTEGILAPVLRSKNRISFDISLQPTLIMRKMVLLVRSEK